MLPVLVLFWGVEKSLNHALLVALRGQNKNPPPPWGLESPARGEILQKPRLLLPRGEVVWVSKQLTKTADYGQSLTEIEEFKTAIDPGFKGGVLAVNN